VTKATAVPVVSPSWDDTGAGTVDRQRDAYRKAINAFGDVAGALGHVKDLDELLHLIAQNICELAGVVRCSVYLRDDSTGLYRGQVGHAPDHDIDARVKRLTCGIEADRFTAEIVATKAPVAVRDALHDPRPIKSTMRDWSVRSMLGVPMVLRSDVIGIIFLDDEQNVRAFDRGEQEIASAFADLAAVAISQAQLTTELRSSLDTVAKQNNMLRRATAVDDRLTKLVLDGGDMREIARTVAELTSKPCTIHDAQDRKIAEAAPPGLDDGITPRLLEPAFRAQPQVSEALDALGRTRAAVVGPFPAAGLHHRFLVAPVAVRDDQWGSVVVMEHKSRFSRFDVLIARRAATIVALELSAERRASNAEWNARASLAGELIRGNRDTAELGRRADYLSVRLDEPHVLCLITARGDDTVTLPDARGVSEAIARRAPDASVLAAGVAEGVAAIIQAPGDVPPLAAIRSIKALMTHVVDDLGAGALLASVSTICRATADYPRAYTQARQVAQCLDQFCPPGQPQVFAADDLGAGRLFLSTTNSVEADSFTRETLGSLLEEKGGELLVTLRVFFDTGRSIRRSAERLSVHENTIRYRLSRIEELTGLTVGSDSDAQLSAQLALLILRLQGRLPEPPAPAVAAE
jgi:sugar diacid utilization regulator